MLGGKIARQCALLGALLIAGANPASCCDCSVKWSMGNGFFLSKSQCGNHLAVTNGANHTIWSTVCQQNFLSASFGNDTIVGEGGNFEITPSDLGMCTGQNITNVDHVRWENSHNKHSVAVSGFLYDCKPNADATSSTEYTAYFWVPSELTDRVSFHVQISQPSDTKERLKKLYFTYSSVADEDFYGLGAQASFASLKNQSVPIFSREQGAGRGDQPDTQLQNLVNFFAGGDNFTTYTSIPQYVSTQARAFYLAENNTAPANFNFTKADEVTVSYNQLTMDGQFLEAQNMLDAVSKVTDYTGKMPALPTWVDEGAIIGIQGGEKKVEKVIKQGMDVDCPIAAVWLQDWSGTRQQATPTGINISRLWWNWESDEDLYPKWDSFVQFLRDTYSVRTLSYINPFFANVSTKPDGFKRDLFSEAAKSQYTVQNLTTGETSLVSSGAGVEAGILDLTNQDARDWFTEVLQDQVWNANISGYMCDFGEYTPITPDTGLKNASDGGALLYHNSYPGDWAAFHHSFVKNLPASSDAVVFHRSANLGSGKNMNLFWAGDQNIAWERNDGIKSVANILGHIGVSGYAQAHSDIGGYTASFVIPDEDNPMGAIGRSAELLGRWGELAAISSAVFRSHEGSIPQINTQSYTNTTTFKYFAHNARLFRALAPYRRDILDNESATKGWPLLRLPVLYHPEDRIARNISSQSFYLGPDLYVAPVLDQGVTRLEVYLPGEAKDSYTHVWSGQSFDGGKTVTVDAPYGKPPIFIVNNAKNPKLDALLDFVKGEKDTIVDVW